MRQYGLIGYPLTHSFSKEYFTEKFIRENISDAEFLNFEVKDIQDVGKIFFDYPQLKGLCITIPHKKNIIQYTTEFFDIVRDTGACNCLKIIGNKKIGFNTDVIGFEKSFTKNLLPHHNKALILGTGGAAVAVEYVLKKLGMQYSFVSRNKNENTFLWAQLNKAIIEKFTVIINCTPLGTFPETEQAPAIPYKYLTPKHYLFDLVYNPPLTQFLLYGKQQNCIIKNGREMLIMQAEENWRIWNEMN
jgi:shikimate dehydrogenase